MANFCSECGAALTGSRKFCSECGTAAEAKPHDPGTSRPLPAGTYFVGDPCYAFGDHGLWIALLESADYTNPQVHILEAHARGRIFTAASTMADGSFFDQFRRMYCVDAGLIGVVPLASADLDNSSLTLMHQLSFEAPFTVSSREDLLLIGNIRIDIS